MGGAGRRPGPSRTRQTILDVARDEFAQRGFDAATVRQIARRAGVDPAMIAHHFGSKQQLFLAALEVPFDPAAEIAEVVDGPREELAGRLLGRLLRVWDSPLGAGALAVVRTAVQREDTAALIRDLALSRALRPLMATMDGTPEERLWRANLAASQIIGLIFTRYVVRLEPLASAAHAEVVASIAPTLQRYLTGPVSRG
ncbi:MAG: TetR family transcriptional regulator [Friedmanniella sp.]